MQDNFTSNFTSFTKYFTKPNKKDDTNLNDTWCICKMGETEDDLVMCEDKTLVKLSGSILNACVSKKYLEGNGFVQNAGKKERSYKKKMFETFLWFNLLSMKTWFLNLWC